MYFTQLDTGDIDPRLFVNRSDDVEWLASGLNGYLKGTELLTGRAFRVTGQKGSGKTIFAKHVLARIKREHGTKGVFIEADCRRCPDSRAVFQLLAQRTVEELFALKDAGVKAVSEELLATARVAAVITQFTSVEVKQIHEHITQHKKAGSLAIGRSLIDFLKITFDVAVQREKKTYESMAGTITFSEYHLCTVLRKLFEDIRAQGLFVVALVDNLDELHHDYRDPLPREHARQEAGWVLELKQAPIALIACMRTYFSEIARDFRAKRTLDPMPGNVLVGILEKRLLDEPEDVKREAAREEIKSLYHKLADIAATPLSYLDWVKALAEQEAFDKDLRTKAVRQYVRAEHATVPFDVIESIARVYDAVDHEIDKATLLEACRGSESDVALVQDGQVVLPNDFWNPTRFSLDPSLYLLHRRLHDKAW